MSWAESENSSAIKERPKEFDSFFSLFLLKGFTLKRLLKPERTDGILIKTFFFLIAGLVWLALLASTYWLLGHCLRLDVFGLWISKKLFSAMTISLFSILFLSSMVSSISRIFLSPELQFLRVLPLELKTLLYERLFMTSLQSSWMTVLFSSAFYVAFLLRFNSSWDLYVITLFGLLFLLAMPCAISASLITIALQFFSGRLIKKSLQLVSLVIFLVFYVLIRYSSPENYIGKENLGNLIEGVESLALPSSGLLPTEWFTNMAYGFFMQQSENSYFYFGLLFLSFACLTILAVEFISLFYRNTLNEISATQPQQESRRKSGFNFKSAVALLWQKDFKVFLRDSRQWSQIFMIFALAFVYVYNFSAIEDSGLPKFISKQMFFVLSSFLGLTISSALAVRYVFPAISLESKSYIILRSLPISEAEIIRAKLNFTVWPLTIFSLCLVIPSLMILKYDPAILLQAAFTTILTSFVIAYFSLFYGVRNPDFQAESQDRVATSIPGFMCMLANIALMIPFLAISCIPAFFLILNPGLYDFSSAWLDLYLANLILLFVSLATCRYLRRLSERALLKIEHF